MEVMTMEFDFSAILAMFVLGAGAVLAGTLWQYLKERFDSSEQLSEDSEPSQDDEVID